MNPKVSIVIPTYNRADYLRITLQSIKNQTFRDFEVIVVDDGSPNDEAKEVCADFSFCKYVKIENSGGPAKPRNVGIDMAKGQYIAFVDDDDLWFPEKLEKQVTILEENPDYGLVHSYCECIDEQGNTIGKIVGKPGTPDVKHGDCFFKMIGNWTVMMPTPLIRGEIVAKSRGFDIFVTPSTEDVEFFTRLALLTKFWFINEPLVWYRVHQGNISGNKANYQDLPIYLKHIAEDAYLKGIIDERQFRKLRNRLFINYFMKGSRGVTKHTKAKRMKLLKATSLFLEFFQFAALTFKLKLKICLKYFS